MINKYNNSFQRRLPNILCNHSYIFLFLDLSIIPAPDEPYPNIFFRYSSGTSTIIISLLNNVDFKNNNKKNLGSGYSVSWILDQVPEVCPHGGLHLPFQLCAFIQQRVFFNTLFPLLDRLHESSDPIVSSLLQLL